ncbi:MAG: hypothetical protein JWR51_2375 [Devosia sp.]|uniref:hypothetical protein n=1 Tax=Devosia sp. TaxID=1871048 RepID=UPI0026212FF3|nr:hypothetical protein [Devosia sp.]MDB5529272.1 hypothetical protein [Devosia sp.]
MTIFGPLSRCVALAGLLVSMGAAATPAFAAPADVALLKSYIGEWRGRGTLTGADTETVVCRLSLKEGNNDKVNYSGRCTLAGTNLAINGTLAYVDASRRFEAAMTSNATFTGIAVGQKRGNGLVFNLRERDQDEEGKEMGISANITLSSDAINVSFEVVYIATGESMRAQVPFSK